MRLRDSEKQQRIKEAMIRLILRDGISGTSVAKIAREAGVSPATIYIYYENKEEMMAEVFREYSHDSYRYLMRRVRPEMSSAELIEAIVRGYYRYTVEHEEEFSFVEPDPRVSEAGRDQAHQRQEHRGCAVFAGAVPGDEPGGHVLRRGRLRRSRG